MIGDQGPILGRHQIQRSKTRFSGRTYELFRRELLGNKTPPTNGLNHKEEFKEYEEFKEFKEMLVGTMISRIKNDTEHR